MFSSEEQIATEYHLNNTFGITLLIAAIILLTMIIKANYYKVGHEKITDFWYEDFSVKNVEVDLRDAGTFGLKVLVFMNGKVSNLCETVGLTLKHDEGSVDF